MQTPSFACSEPLIQAHTPHPTPTTVSGSCCLRHSSPLDNRYAHWSMQQAACVPPVVLSMPSGLLESGRDDDDDDGKPSAFSFFPSVTPTDGGEKREPRRGTVKKWAVRGNWARVFLIVVVEERETLRKVRKGCNL